MRTGYHSLLLLGLGLLPLSAGAVDFVYEGFLEDGGVPANGRYELSVTPQYEPGFGPLNYGAVVFPSVEVVGGHFRIEFALDDAPADHTWFTLAVRGEKDVGVPIALPGLTKATAATTAGTCWSTSGDAGTDASLNFLGTLDAQPLVLRTNNAQSLRIEPSSEMFAGIPATANVIAGSAANSVRVGARGATIAGGGTPAGDSDPDYGGEGPNQAFGHYASIGGGMNNRAGTNATPATSSAFSTVGGGFGNQATDYASVVSGGLGNLATADYASIGGGFHNEAEGQFNTIAGGHQNVTMFSNSYSSIGGGNQNVATAQSSVIAGGSENAASGVNSSIGGGSLNSVGGEAGVISGGNANAVTQRYSTVGGGSNNTISAERGTIAGGTDSIVTGYAGTVGGGQLNVASGSSSTVAGGYTNRATGIRSAVAGGGGNAASGNWSAVAGGLGNCAGGHFSWAGGHGAKIRRGSESGPAEGGCSGVAEVGVEGDQGTFVWADSQAGNFVSTGANQFLVRADGGVGIGTNEPVNPLHVVASINDVGSVANHVVQIENSSTGSAPDVLALKVGTAGNPGSSVNFITFFGASATSLGAIEGNGSGGVVLVGPGNDFAEYLPKGNANETILPGDLVGVHAGRVSRNTVDADRLLVASTAPIVAGNDPGSEHREDYVLTALVGQAVVRVAGPVARGDWLIASGNDDGLARAVDPADAEAVLGNPAFGQVVDIVDSAGGDSSTAAVNGVRQVRVLLGENSRSQAALLRRLAAENARLKGELAQLRVQQTSELAQLRVALAELRTLVTPSVASKD